MGKVERQVFFVGPRAVAEGIPRAFLGTPFLIDEAGSPDFWVFEYMLARRNGDWDPAVQGAGYVRELYGKEVLRADLGFLRNRAFQLNVFRRWLLEQQLAYGAVKELDLEQFAQALEEGSHGDGIDCLQPGSVNQYLTSAIDLLHFGARRGWREPLRLQTRRSRHLRRESIRTPKVMRRLNPSEIKAWYSEDQIATFIEAFETSSVKLCASILYRTGLRISECVSLGVDAFPDLPTFNRDPKRRLLRVTGKFRKTRNVPIDAELVRQVDSYKRLDRQKIVRGGGDVRQLIVGTSNANKVGALSPRYVQKEFARVRATVGFEALSPHLMRHHFAAHYLLRSWRRRASITGANPVAFEIAPAQALLSHELFVLKDGLGHSSLDTTVSYLNAISFLLNSPLPSQYSDELDEGIA